MKRQQNCLYILLGGALLCLVFMFTGGPGPHASRSFVQAWGLGHLVSFTLWSYLFLLWRERQPFARQALELLLFGLLFGAGTELLQSAFGRKATWQDFGVDLLGCLLSLAFARKTKEHLSGRALLTARTLVLVTVAWLLTPFARVSTDELIAAQQFPLLSGFETALEVDRWGGSNLRRLDRQYVFSGDASLRVELGTGRYPGVALKHFPADWSRYQTLRMYIYNPAEEPLQLYFRIHDQRHRASGEAYSDRYNGSLLLGSGWTRFDTPLERVAVAPKSRRMELDKIAGVILFADRLEQPRTIYLDEVGLLR